MLGAIKDETEREAKRKSIIDTAAAALERDPYEWAWDQLRGGSHYGEPNICLHLYSYLAEEKRDSLDSELLSSWLKAEPHSTTRIQLAYCPMAERFPPWLLSAMWFSTSHHRDKNLLLCSLMQRVAKNMEANSKATVYDLDQDYIDCKSMLGCFTRENIPLPTEEEEQWAKLITRNQEKGTRLLEQIKSEDSDDHSE